VVEVGLWERLTSAVRRIRIRIRLGDEAWAAVQPVLSKLYAGYWKLTRRRRRSADALSYTAAQWRASWQAATRRRRAAVGVLAVLPFAMASGVTAMVLPAGGEPRAGPAQERKAADAPAKQDDLGATTATASSRAERPNPARAAPRGAGSGSAAEGAAVTPDPAASSDVGSLDGGSGGGDSPGGHSGAGGGGDSPGHERSGSRGVERRTSAAPSPPARTPSGRALVGGDGQRSAPSPPAAKAPAPQSGAPAAPAPTAAPPVTEPAPEVPEPDVDLEEDSDSSKGDGPGNSDRRGPPADRGGGGEYKDDDEDVDP
jgi:hypothetical protein